MSNTVEQPRWAPALLLLLPTWVAMAWLISKAQWFWTNRPDLQFGWVVVALCGYLLTEAWPKRPVVRAKWTLLNATLGVLGVALLFVVQIYQAAFGMMAASITGLAIAVLLIVSANLFYVFGFPGWRRLIFCFLFLYVALPMPSAIQNVVVSGLQSKVASLNVEILNLCGIPAERVGSLIHLPRGTVGIDEACSGIRSLQATLMATLFVGYLTLERLSMQVVLVAIGVGLAFFGNVIRSLFLSYVANTRGLQAVDTFHDSAGWSILAFTAVGVIAASWGLGKLESEARQEGGNEGNE